MKLLTLFLASLTLWATEIDPPKADPPVIPADLSAELGWAQFELAQAQAVYDKVKAKAEAIAAKAIAACGPAHELSRTDGKLICNPKPPPAK